MNNHSKPTLLILSCLFAISVVSFTTAQAEGEKHTRQESLEIEGLEAGCHVCEWRPQIHEKQAKDQCGVNHLGSPNIGVFECGFETDCTRVCHFLGCASDSPAN